MALTQYVVEHFAHDAGSDVDQGSVSTYLLPLVALVVGQLPGEAGVEFFRDAGWQRLATGEVFADARWQCLRLAIAVAVTTENPPDVVEVIVVAALEIVIIVIVVVAMGGFFTFLGLVGLVLAAGVFAILAFGLVGLAVAGVGQGLASAQDERQASGV